MKSEIEQTFIADLFAAIRQFGKSTSAAVDRAELVITRLGVFWTVLRGVELLLVSALLVGGLSKGMPMAFHFVRGCWDKARQIATTAKDPGRSHQNGQNDDQFEAEIIDDGTPFISLSQTGAYGVMDANVKKVIEKEMFSRAFFESQSLTRGTRYVPQLARASDIRSTVTLTNGYMKRIVVRLATPSGSTSGYGLVPLRAYEDYLSALGR